MFFLLVGRLPEVSRVWYALVINDDNSSEDRDRNIEVKENKNEDGQVIIKNKAQRLSKETPPGAAVIEK